MNLRDMMGCYAKEGLTRDLAAARVCQNIVIKAIAEGPLSEECGSGFNNTAVFRA